VKAYLWHWRVSGERRGGRGGGGIRRRRRRNDSTRSGLGVGVSLILRRVLEEGKKLGGDRPQTPSRGDPSPIADAWHPSASNAYGDSALPRLRAHRLIGSNMTR